MSSNEELAKVRREEEQIFLFIGMTFIPRKIKVPSVAVVGADGCAGLVLLYRQEWMRHL